MYQRQIKDVMQRSLLTCLPTTPIEAVARRLTDYHVHALVVVDDDGYAIGVVSQTDLLLAHCRTESDLAEPCTAGDIMTSNVMTCTPESTIFEAVTTMTRNHIHRLVVVKASSPKLYPLGIVSMTDIIRYLLQDSPEPASFTSESKYQN